MLEKVKPGDLCVFSNGEQARVTRIVVMQTEVYRFYLDKPVSGIAGMSKYNFWEYQQDGKLINTSSKMDNSIIKLIAE